MTAPSRPTGRWHGGSSLLAGTGDSDGRRRTIAHRLAVVLAGSFALAGSQSAPAQTTCVIDKITLDVSRQLSVDGSGTRIAFTSDADLVPGGNVDGNSEVFLFDSTTRNFTQVTDSTGPSVTSQYPRISRDGRRITFTSDGDLVTGENPDGSYEVFLFDVDTAELDQLSSGADSGPPSIDADGTRIAFASDFDLFLFDTTTGAPTRITDTSGAINFFPSVNNDGTRLAFISSADLVPGRNPDRSWHVFLYDLIADAFTQVAGSAGQYIDTPSISGDGSRVAFVSTEDLVPGGNADGNEEIFLYDGTSDSMTQITDTAGVVNLTPSLSALGRHITYIRDLEIEGSSFRDIYLFDVASGTSTKIPSNGQFNDSPWANADGSRVAFALLDARGTWLALATCQATAMLLNDQRFQVDATWRTFEGESGIGQAVQLTNDSGYFWFFNPDNIEVVVKVLDACRLPDWENFWVFAAGLTNVEVTLTVTDTNANQQRVYENQMGEAFQPIQDTAGFHTCEF
jgi:Tol biopolymer transport system component